VLGEGPSIIILGGVLLWLVDRIEHGRGSET
jgi:hypothetical protein